MKNTECSIYIITKHGYTQSYRKGKNGWTQISPNGKVRLLSAEQLLSHILPPLAGIGQVTVRVEPDNRDIKLRSVLTAPASAPGATLPSTL